MIVVIKNVFINNILNSHIRPNYDTSTKPFEIQEIQYRFDKYKRVLLSPPVWRHCAYYNSELSAKDAIRDIRNGWGYEAYRDYPAMGGGVEAEKQFPHITPSINIYRFRIIKRDL